MLTPLSISPYNSRFTLDIDLADKIYKNTYEYVNMIYHGFYGGTSLQSQELNELQENIQSQLSLANTLSGNWLQYPKTTVPDVENYIVHTDIFPVDPQGITFVTSTSSTLNLSKGYYLYPTEWGNISFVGIPQMNNITTSSGDLYTGISFSNIQPRTVSGLQPEWNILRDNANDPFNNIGCRRIQLFLNEDTTVPPTQRSQIYAVSWHPISGDVDDWSAGGTNDVVQFDYVKPSVSLMRNGAALTDYGSSPYPSQAFETVMTSSVPGIRRQLRMLEDNNNLLNTNIKNIIPHRYDSGTLFSDSGSGFLIWPTPEKMLQFKTDWIEVLKRIDVNKTDPDGLLIANTRLVADQESTVINNNFNITPTSYNTITSFANYTLPLYDTPSLFSQMNGITWDGQGTAFCGLAGCGYNTDYLVWNKSIEKISTAAFSEVFLTPFKQRYSNITNKVRSTNYESNITRPNDGYPDINGHESYHDNLFGDSASIALYGLFNSSSDVWGISGDSNLARIPTGQPTFTWHGNPWNAFLISIQGVRSSKRGFIFNNKNNSIFVWIAPKDFKELNTSTLVGFNNSPYWDEMVRHSALTGVEVFGFFNGIEATTTSATDKAKRIEQFTVINKILEDINTKLGGYTPISLDVRRISYNSEYVISGAPTLDGKYLWRVTPKQENNIILVNGSVVIKKVGEIGIWITTDTTTAPNISIQDADMHQYFSRIAFDGGRQNQREWGAWGNKTIAMYNGSRLESNNSTNGIQPRPFGTFFTNPNGLTSSSWHNIIYELTYPIFKWGNRSILYQYPFGGFRIDNQFNGEPQYGEEGPVAGYMRFKDLYPNTAGTNPSQCSARWKGMKEAFNDVINGKLIPTDTSYPPIDKPCNIVIYLPSFMGWATYREETCKYWEDSSRFGNDDAKDTAFYLKLDSYINDIIYIQKNGKSSTGVKGRLYVGIDSSSQSATPESISAYRSISKTQSSSNVPGAAYTNFGYKAKNVNWYATNGGYRTDKLELADWYVKTKLEQAGISVLAEARPASSITQISIPEVSGGVYRGTTSTTPLLVTSWGNFASIEATMWTSRTYTAANEKFDEILRWPSNSFEVVHNTVNPEGNVFNLPSKISVLVNGVTYEKLHYPGWNAVPLVYSPFYYLHTLNALVDHIKYNDKHNAGVVDRTDIQLNHKNIITLETSLYANNLDIPFANNSESSTGEYYIWNKDTMGVSSYYAEPRELFEIDDFVALPPQYTGGLWTSGVTGNKEYWDNTFRGASFGEFVSKIRTISSQVSPPVGVSNGTITEYATGFTLSTTYPNDIYSRNMLKDIVGVTVSDPFLTTIRQTVTDYEVWALHWPTFPDVFSTTPKIAIDYYGPGVTGQLESGIGATFGNIFTDSAGDLQYRFKFLSVAPSMQAPPSSISNWNGWNPPGDGYTYDSIGTGQYSWNWFKEHIKKVPESRRMIQGRPWEGGNFFSSSRWGYNNYYTKTADGTTYEGLRFNTPWADVAATDTQISVKKFLTACKNDDLKFSYFTTDQEQSHLPWHFRKGFNVFNNGGVTAQDTPTVPNSWNTLDVRSDIRFISAIINDNRFKTQKLNDETGLTNKTLFDFYSEAFTTLKTKYEFLTGSSINLTVDQSLLPFTGLTNADPSAIASSTFWTPYSGPSNNYRGRDAKSMGYEYQHIVFPSLDYMLDNIAWNNSHKKAFVDVFKDLNTTDLDVFKDVTSIQYNTYEINESESPFLKDGNGMPYYTNASRGNVKNNAYTPVYYALAENSMFPTFIPVTSSTIRLNPETGRFDPAGITHFLDNPKYIIGTEFNTYWPIRSGYIKGSTFDLEKYSFQAYLVGPDYYNQGGVKIGCSSCALPTASVLVRYPETFPDTPNNTEKFYLELAFKHFTNELIHVRSTHRSDPLMYQKYSPLITGFASSPNPNENLHRVYSHNKYTKLYWKEFVWQLLMHGVNFFQYWDYKYTANLGLWDLHLILDQWRTLTKNSRVRPCNSVGEVSGFDNKILDRFVLEDMYEKCIISGGKILSGPMQDRYIWRISVSPKFISWNSDQSFGKVVGTLYIPGYAPVQKKLAVIGDGDIRPVSDFVLNNRGPCPAGVPCPADFDGDGDVTETDIVEFSKYQSENRLGFTVINPPGIKTAPTFIINNP